MENKEIVITKERCIGCGLCEKVCPAHNLYLKDGKAEKVLKNCLLCGQCTAVCPKKAIEAEGFTDEVFEKPTDIGLDPDKVLETIRFRRTVRRFQREKVPREVLDKILEAGRLTHTGTNSQNVSYMVLEEKKEEVEKIAVSLFRKLKRFADPFNEMVRMNKVGDDFFFFGAPTVVLVLSKDKTNGVLAAQNMEFVAEAFGLGVLMSGFFTSIANVSGKIKKTLRIPKGKKVVMTLVLGYPDVKYLRSVHRNDLDVKYF